MVWTFGKTFSLEAFAFIQGIILARILFPSDYGLIAMTQVFLLSVLVSLILDLLLHSFEKRIVLH